jgi:hypothetical protein
MFKSSTAKSGGCGLQPRQKRPSPKRHLAAAGGGACPEARRAGPAAATGLSSRLFDLFATTRGAHSPPVRACSLRLLHSRNSRSIPASLLDSSSFTYAGKECSPRQGHTVDRKQFHRSIRKNKSPRFLKKYGHSRKQTISKRLNFGHTPTSGSHCKRSLSLARELKRCRDAKSPLSNLWINLPTLSMQREELRPRRGL